MSNRQEKRKQDRRKKPLIALGVPAKDFVYKNFQHSFALMLSHASQKFDIAIVDQDSPLVHWGRNDMVDKALEVNAEKLVMIDSDQVVQQDLINRLYSRKREIIFANYPKRVEPHENVNPEPIEANGGCDRVLWAATGVCMIDTKVFRKTEWPWFDTVQRLDGKTRYRVGEDQYFCWKATNAGYNIWVDPTIKVGHTGLKDYYLEEK